MSAQTSYSNRPAHAFAGQLADTGPRRVISCIAAIALAAGLLVVKSTSGEQRITAPSAPDADGDAIIATGGSTGGIQTLTGVALDGVVGDDVMAVPRNVTLTFSSHANWDATVAVVTGKDADGATVTENFSIPDGGGATVTGAVLFRQITSLVIPAQSGTAGTFTMGTGSLLGSIDREVRGITLYESMREPGLFAADTQVAVIRQGRVWVSAETAVAEGDPVYVRLVAGTGETAGALRATPDANDCVRLNGARFASTTTGAGLAVVELNLP